MKENIMTVGTVPNPTFPSIGYAINASRNGRMSLPVAPSLYIYSHFKHVNGTPAPEGTRGVNISKLKILDTLIEQLSKIKKKDSNIDRPDADEEKRIDALIEQLQKQLHSARAMAPYTPAAPATGMLFNISA
jgi:hypothetical protein